MDDARRGLDGTASDGQAARIAHYADFYAEHPVRGAALVIGNCQAESLRVAIDGDDLLTIRIPPVHELVDADLPYLQRALAAASVLISQPIRDDYRGMPLGTRQLRTQLGPSATSLIIPAIRHRSLHPAQLVVRLPDRDVDDPPVVAYHDARTLIEALGHPRPTLRPETVAAIAQASTAELARREERHGAVRISDLFARPRFPLLRTINHPGNPVWLELAGRVRRELGLDDAVADPGRELLSSVIAPKEDVVIAAWGLDDEPDPFWRVDGRSVHDDEIREVHLRWYADHPESLRLAAERHSGSLDELMSA